MQTNNARMLESDCGAYEVHELLKLRWEITT